MPKFTDADGRTWQIAVDVWVVREVQRETGLLLTAVADDDFALLQTLSDDRDPIPLLTTLWVLVREQADRLGVDERSFGMGLRGKGLADARDALLAAIVDFFSDPAQGRALRTLIEKAKTTSELIGTRALAEIEKLDPDQLAASITASVSNSPESPASIPGDTRSAS